MNDLFVLLWMFFNHVLDDYFLQGCLANLKQKSYWKENAPDTLYNCDYIMALIMHSISWSFMIMLPVFTYFSFNVTTGMFLMFMFNVIVHALVDHMKANMKILNLVQDQLIHIMQIFATCAIFMESTI